MTRTYLASALLAALLAGTALNASARDLQQELDDQRNGYSNEGQASAQPTTGGIQLVSGGIGDSGLDDISAVQNHYDLKLVFADTTGAYLADIGVQVRDRHGNLVVNANSSGPIMLMRLKPGTYTVSSSDANTTKTERISVSGHGLKTCIMHLPESES